MRGGCACSVSRTMRTKRALRMMRRMRTTSLPLRMRKMRRRGARTRPPRASQRRSRRAMCRGAAATALRPPAAGGIPQTLGVPGPALRVQRPRVRRPDTTPCAAGARSRACSGAPGRAALVPVQAGDRQGTGLTGRRSRTQAAARAALAPTLTGTS